MEQNIHPTDNLNHSIQKTPISVWEKATYHAVRKAYDLVITAREKSAHIRTWAIDAIRDVDSLVQWIDDFQNKELPDTPNATQFQRKISELNEQESKVLTIIHRYLKEMSVYKNELKLHNPPLTSQQLQPFQNAIEDEKRRTIASLGVLMSHIETLTRRKLSICQDFQNLFPE